MGQCSQNFQRHTTTGEEEEVLKGMEVVKSFKHQYDVTLLAHRVTTEQLGGDTEDLEVYGQWWLYGLQLCSGSIYGDPGVFYQLVQLVWDVCESCQSTPGVDRTTGCTSLCSAAQADLPTGCLRKDKLFRL